MATRGKVFLSDAKHKLMNIRSEWFRSAKMDYISIVVQEELAHACVTELGRLGTVQLTDMNPTVGAFQRRYVSEISRIDIMERRLRYMDELLKKHDVAPKPPPRSEALLDALAQRSNEGQSPATLLVDMEALLEEKERELRTLAGYGASLTQDYNSKVEFKHVLDKTRAFAREDPNIPRGAEPAGSDIEVPLSAPSRGGGGFQDSDLTIRFKFVAGTILQEERLPFERMIFRVSRGNAYMRFSEIEEPIVDPITNQTVHKHVFIIFYQAQYIQDKLNHVCQAFSATLYPIPNMDSTSEINQLLEQTNIDIQERSMIARKNRVDLMRLLSDLSRHIKTWTLTLKKEKATYHSLNLMTADVSGVLRAEGWVISNKMEQVTMTISRVHRRTSSRSLPNWVTIVPEDQRPPKPPTFFPVNRFTEVYQLLIDTYGIPKYQEVNPALFATMTFPFCFGVMFGDIGHGLWLLIFALFVVWKEKDIAKNTDFGELGQLIHGGRYVLVFMGLFSTYCGFIYNDCMSLGLALFPVTWVPINNTVEIDYIPVQPPQVYPWGADPTWRIADNELSFFNSYKMKFSVIFGVSHMLVGLFLKASNAIHFHKGKKGPNLDLWFEAIPQILFMAMLFGYMDFLIIYKWSIPWGNDCTRSIGCQPPSLITTLIAMVLTPTTVTYPLYDGQDDFQIWLVLCAVLMVPIMLIPKPCILVRRMYARQRALHDEGPGMDDGASDGGESQGGTSNTELLQRQSHGGGDHGHEEGVGDIVIHQAIETIEFVLGSISNTASYLRLWALSLAHSQLAAVFWERTLLGWLKTDGGAAVIATYLATAVFFAVTLVVLMMMDNLECFLHSLRLHWVEFMNKFFKAEGMKFTPLHFETLFDIELQAKKD